MLNLSLELGISVWTHDEFCLKIHIPGSFEEKNPRSNYQCNSNEHLHHPKCGL